MHAAKTKVTVTNGYFWKTKLSTAPSPMPIDPVMAMERINLIKM